MTDSEMMAVFQSDGGLDLDEVTAAIAHLLKRASSIARTRVYLDIVPFPRRQVLLWGGGRVIYRGDDLESLARSVLESDPAASDHHAMSQLAVT